MITGKQRSKGGSGHLKPGYESLGSLGTCRLRVEGLNWGYQETDHRGYRLNRTPSLRGNVGS